MDSIPTVSGSTSGITRNNRGYLPHWTTAGGIYHVTFRLNDSLPAKILTEITQERKNILNLHNHSQRNLTSYELEKLKHLFSQKIDHYLDSGKGKCLLTNNRIAEMVVGALQHFEDIRYELFSWCIMPNHVHVMVKPMNSHSLGDILHSWKSFTAHKANQLLKNTGSFWSREYYDHLIRDEFDFYHMIQYICNNPKEAGLSNWKWVWHKSIAGETPALRGKFK